MKQTVDLTQNRMFSAPASNRNTLINLDRIIRDPTIKFPWIGEQTSDLPDENDPIIVGNNLERKRLKEYMSFESGDKCACCGKRITPVLWWKCIFGLCKQCSDYMDKTYNKVSWRDL